MAQTPSKTLTLAEFLELPETKPANEYINGQIIQKPMLQGKHSVIQGELVPAINGVVKSKRAARAFPELRCTFGNCSIVPDIAVFLWHRIPRDQNGEIAAYLRIFGTRCVNFGTPLTRVFIGATKTGNVDMLACQSFDRQYGLCPV